MRKLNIYYQNTDKKRGAIRRTVVQEESRRRYRQWRGHWRADWRRWWWRRRRIRPPSPSCPCPSLCFCSCLGNARWGLPLALLIVLARPVVQLSRLIRRQCKFNGVLMNLRQYCPLLDLDLDWTMENDRAGVQDGMMGSGKTDRFSDSERNLKGLGSWRLAQRHYCRPAKKNVTTVWPLKKKLLF